MKQGSARAFTNRSDGGSGAQELGDAARASELREQAAGAGKATSGPGLGLTDRQEFERFGQRRHDLKRLQRLAELEHLLGGPCAREYPKADLQAFQRRPVPFKEDPDLPEVAGYDADVPADRSPDAFAFLDFGDDAGEALATAVTVGRSFSSSCSVASLKLLFASWIEPAAEAL